MANRQFWQFALILNALMAVMLFGAWWFVRRSIRRLLDSIGHEPICRMIRHWRTQPRRPSLWPAKSTIAENSGVPWFAACHGICLATI